MVIIINYVCSISYEVFCFLNFLHMICASSQNAIWSILSREVIMFQMILEYDEFCIFLLNIKVFNIMTRLSLHFWKWNKMYHIISKIINFKWQDFSLFKNFEENLYISHTMHYKSWRFKCFISWKLVRWPIFFN